jgi:hypothetical protein
MNTIPMKTIHLTDDEALALTDAADYARHMLAAGWRLANKSLIFNHKALLGALAKIAHAKSDEPDNTETSAPGACSEVDNKIAKWHQGGDHRPLHEALGWTAQGYAQWVQTGNPPNAEVSSGAKTT